MSAQGQAVLAWLEKVIGEREDVARAAEAINPSPWTAGRAEDTSVTHIALNDPASVLRRCATDRKLLELHAQDSLPNGIDLDECRTCGGANEPWPCPTLLTLAEGYGWTEGER